jgi:hypothetical protein
MIDMSNDFFAVMVLFNINLFLYLIYFTVVFVCKALWPPDSDMWP